MDKQKQDELMYHPLETIIVAIHLLKAYCQKEDDISKLNSILIPENKIRIEKQLKEIRYKLSDYEAELNRRSMLLNKTFIEERLKNALIEAEVGCSVDYYYRLLKELDITIADGSVEKIIKMLQTKEVSRDCWKVTFI